MSVVKYSTSVVNNTFKTNSIVTGVEGATNFGPTSSTGFWHGIDAPSGGYTIYTLTESRQEPSIVVAHNNTELIYFARSFGGININSATEAINFLLTGSTNTIVLNENTYPLPIITDGLIINIDPAFTPCYSGGTDVRDLKHTTEWDWGGSTITFDSATQNFNFDDSSDGKYIVSADSFAVSSPTTGMTYDFWFNLSSSGSSYLPSLYYDYGQGGYPFVWIYENGGGWFIQYSNGITYYAVGVAYIGRGNWINLTITVQYGLAANAYFTSYVSGVIALDHYMPGQTTLFPSLTTNKYIGDYATAGGHSFNGKIGPIKIYNRVLTQAEVLQNFCAIRSRYGL